MKAFSQTFEIVSKRNIWNYGRNINGITKDSTNASHARIYGGYEDGGFRDYNSGSLEWEVGAIAESVVHFPRLSMKGSFGFEQKQGRDMCGSMFIHPGEFPIDVLEFTPGTKNLQTYSFDGGISYRLTDHLYLGGQIEFLSANYSKTRDLRHSNYRLDMTISPSILYHSGDFSFGATYFFQKIGETADAEVIGTANTIYDAFLDKGLMYGIFEDWDGSGIHLNEAGVNGLPVSEFYNGVALQLGYKGFFAELGYAYQSGKVGEKDYIWFNYPAHNIFANLAYKFDKNDRTHIIRAGVEYNRLKNYENILQKESVGGVTNITKTGSNIILDKSTLRISPQYNFISSKWRADWTAEFNLESGIASQIYPFTHYAEFINFKTDIHAYVNIWLFELGARAGFQKGWYEEKEKMQLEGDFNRAPDRIKEYSSHWIDYNTASKINVGLSLKCSVWKGLYIMAEGSYHHGLGLSFLTKASRWSAGLSVGYDF